MSSRLEEEGGGQDDARNSHVDGCWSLQWRDVTRRVHAASHSC